MVRSELVKRVNKTEEKQRREGQGWESGPVAEPCQDVALGPRPVLWSTACQGDMGAFSAVAFVLDQGSKQGCPFLPKCLVLLWAAVLPSLRKSGSLVSTA